MDLGMKSIFCLKKSSALSFSVIQNVLIFVTALAILLIRTGVTELKKLTRGGSK